MTAKMESNASATSAFLVTSLAVSVIVAQVLSANLGQQVIRALFPSLSMFPSPCDNNSPDQLFASDQLQTNHGYTQPYFITWSNTVLLILLFPVQVRRHFINLFIAADSSDNFLSCFYLCTFDRRACGCVIQKRLEPRKKRLS